MVLTRDGQPPLRATNPKIHFHLGYLILFLHVSVFTLIIFIFMT
jgi:hypothetical protein